MDRVIEKKKWNAKRIGIIVFTLLLIGLIAFSFLGTQGGRKLNVDKERLSIFEVKEAVFQEFIPVNGTVLPIRTIYLDASVGGRVEEKYVEDGAVLKKGDPILKLSNTDLELSLVNQEIQVLNLLTQAQIAKTSAQQVSISNRNQMADVEQGLIEAKRIYELNQKLFDKDAIGKQDYLKSKNEYLYQKEKVELTKQILKQDSTSSIQKVFQDQETYNRTQSALELMRQKVGDLVVRAPVDGQLTSFDAEIGQSKNAGERLGQVDVLTGYKVNADIDEHYINRVFIGQKAEFKLKDENYDLKITKVYSQVKDGKFRVDFEFADKTPESIRRGQSLQIRLALSDETSALLLKKGGFYQQTGGNWLFIIDKSGQTAYRTDIQLGRQNPDYYEILDGLQPGDRVIISSYEGYDKIQQLNIK
ncbi:MAG TPA: HlyD family efflux transporter periplasmic adaptor subunit [Gelidibacter sp.]|uniref:efflux RND transporter periplasmic adaptor subunit n=1 Tax=Gelidibacter sp. TaxID=2018083 RepID=UPI002BA9F823|nr:HlyD family efflux transporter periplasmic adaptor subunit [Gelidibacter sp.]HXJ99157.1 HlyD family efflux transporter periplasmic adaptor subunit [Gelidibacter sp.]